MKIKLFLIFFLLCGTEITFGQSAHQLLREGDQYYKKGEYNKAETAYRKADEIKPVVKSKYNRSNAIYKQNRYDEAIQSYEEAAATATSEQDKADIYYNLGNAHYQNKDYKESIDAYKKSLGYNPDDIKTKENLALARQALKKVQQQQRQNSKQNQDNKDKQDDQQDQDNSNQQNQDNPNGSPESKDKHNEQQAQNQINEDKNNSKMSKEEAKKLLEIMDEEEKKVQQNMRRSGEKSQPRKNW